MSKKKILLFCPYPLNTVPGQRLKYEQYLDYLSKKGYEIYVFPFFSNKTYRILYKKGHFIQKLIGVIYGYINRIIQLFKIPGSDGIYVFLHVSPLGPPILEWLYTKLSSNVIYDIDDMVHQLKTTPTNNIARLFKSSKRYFLLLQKSNHVITCTPELDRIAKIYNNHTTDISSTINTQKYISCNEYKNDHKLILGWTGSHSTVPYLHLLDNVLKRLSIDYDISLLVMGTNSFKIRGVEVNTVNWSSNIEIPTLQRMDIGLYPLPDDEWVKGKSGLKALQYMAMGLPVVATRIGCNDRVVVDNVSGFLVSTEDEWYAALCKLIESCELRKRFGMQAKKRVEELYSIEANKDKYLSIFEKVYRNR